MFNRPVNHTLVQIEANRPSTQHGNGDVAWHNYDGWDIVALMNTSGAIHESYTRGVSIAGDIGLGASTVGVGVIAVAGGVGVIGYAHFELVHDLNSLRHDFDDCARRCRERETK